MKAALSTPTRLPPGPEPGGMPGRAGLLPRWPDGGMSGPSNARESGFGDRRWGSGGPGDRPGSSEIPLLVTEVLRSPGQVLDPATRDFMETRFDHDFGTVRVHADSRAADSAAGMDAEAYTVGANVVFGHGAFQPGTAAGRRLLAHELAHVIQQQHRDSNRSISPASAGDRWEQEAEHAADDVARGRRARASSSGNPPGLQRQTRPSQAGGPDGDGAWLAGQHRRWSVRELIRWMNVAIRMASRGPRPHPRADLLLHFVRLRLRELCSAERIRRAAQGDGEGTGVSRGLIEYMAGGAVANLDSIIRRVRQPHYLGNLVHHYVSEIEAARETLEVLAGERTFRDSPALAVTNQHTVGIAVLGALGVFAATISVVALGTVAAEAAAVTGAAGAIESALATEVAILRSVGMRALTWALQNPQASIALAEYGAGTILEICSVGGVEPFVDRLLTPEGLLITIHDIILLRGAVHGPGPGITRRARVRTVSPAAVRVELVDSAPPAVAAPRRAAGSARSARMPGRARFTRTRDRVFAAALALANPEPALAEPSGFGGTRGRAPIAAIASPPTPAAPVAAATPRARELQVGGISGARVRGSGQAVGAAPQRSPSPGESSGARGPAVPIGPRAMPRFGLRTGGASTRRDDSPPAERIRTPWNPSGRRSNCGFCSLSRAFQVLRGEFRSAEDLYASALAEIYPTATPEDRLRNGVQMELFADRAAASQAGGSLSLPEGMDPSDWTITFRASRLGLRMTLDGDLPRRLEVAFGSDARRAREVRDRADQRARSLLRRAGQRAGDASENPVEELEDEQRDELMRAVRATVDRDALQWSSSLPGEYIVYVSSGRRVGHYFNLTVDARGQVSGFDAQNGRTYAGWAEIEAEWEVAVIWRIQ